MQRKRFLVMMATALLTSVSSTGQPAKSTSAHPKKATKVSAPVTFEAHNEGSVEGPIFGDENLVSVTIDSTGIHYQNKGQDKPTDIKWDDLTGWQPNNFTSRSASNNSTASGDYGIGLYLGARYFSFRTRSGRDYLAAVKALRRLASGKERPGIG